MAAFSLRGYCRTLRGRSACTPAMTMSRLTTIAMTGRRMKRSVNFMSRAPGASRVCRARREVRLSRCGVAHRHRDAVPELEGSVAHDALAGGEAGGDLHEVAAPLAQPDEGLLRLERRLARLVLLLLQHVDGVAVGRVDDGRGR